MYRVLVKGDKNIIRYTAYRMIGRRIQIGAVGVWAALGFNRGLQHHDYIHKENMEAHRKNMAKYREHPTIYTESPGEMPAKYFLSSVAYGFYGSFWYINPFVAPAYFAKECYRVEIYARGLEGEKSKKYYQTLDVYFIL